MKLLALILIFAASGYQFSSPLHSGKLANHPAVPTIVASMQETSNANSSTGAAPHRNEYNNCATSCSGGVPQPPNSGAVSHGQAWCNASQVVTCGTFGTKVVSSTISGTGTSLLANGNGAGGFDSAASVTATYGGTTGTGCNVGTNNNPSNHVPRLVLPGNQTGGKAVFGITTNPANANTSLLAVTKYNINGDAGRFIVRQDCAAPNVTNISGEHYEWDDNYNDSNGSYFGFGKHYDFSTSGVYYCPQGCSAWKKMKLCPVGGGACITSYSWPAGQYLYSESYEHWNAGCGFNSGSACAFYDAICLQLWNGGVAVNSLTCYNIQDATTSLTPSFIPVKKTTWTHPQYAPQHQWDINSTSKTLTATVQFSNLVAYF